MYRFIYVERYVRNRNISLNLPANLINRRHLIFVRFIQNLTLGLVKFNDNHLGDPTHKNKPVAHRVSPGSTPVQSWSDSDDSMEL